jgi:hypothetical protein
MTDTASSIALPDMRGSGECVSPARKAGPAYLVIVARDQPDLLRHLRQAFSECAAVEVIMDRRSGEPDFRDRHFLIIPQPVLVQS